MVHKVAFDWMHYAEFFLTSSTDLHSIEAGMQGADKCLSCYFLLQNMFAVREKKDAANFYLALPIDPYDI